MIVDCSVTIDPRFPDQRKSLAVQQPYANLIMEGIKAWEIRKKPIDYRGKVWIYSSKRVIGLQERAEILKKYCMEDNPFLDCYNLLHTVRINDTEEKLGHLLGTVDIIGCFSITKEQFEDNYLHFSGRGFPKNTDHVYVWELANPQKVTPIKYERPHGAIIFSTKGRIIPRRVIP